MPSFGETLKRERELREISLRQISEATKISIRYLEALEQNRFELLPGGLFNKGFIRAYATYVGLDSESMVNSYLHEIAASGGAHDAASGGAQPALHRPAMIPQRRAASRPEAAAPIGPAPPFAEVPAARMARPEAPPPVASAVVAEHARVPAADHAGAMRATASRAISGIEEIDRTAASSRALLWIFSLVAGAGVVFLILTLATGRPPQRADAPATSPVPSVEAPSGSDAAVSLATGTAETPNRPPRNESRDAAPPAIASMGGHAEETLKVPEAPQAPDVIRVPEEQVEPPRPERRVRTAPMDLQVQSVSDSWVQLSCDGERVMDGMLRTGETFTTQCLNVIRISATDAGALSLSINGAACLPLGEPGTRVYGYTIRSDDFRQICPPSGRGADGRP